MENMEPLFISKIKDKVDQFSKLSFAGQRRILEILNQAKDNQHDAELKDLTSKLRILFAHKHTRLVVASTSDRRQRIS